MRSYLFLFALQLISPVVFSQEITVTDRLTQQRIPGVKVYCKDRSVQRLTNVEGRFRLEPFAGCDSIYLAYSGYRTEVYSYEFLHKRTGIELTDDHLSFDPLVVTANRWEQELSKVPHLITNIDVRSVEIQGYQTSADLLSGSGYVFVQKSQLAGGSPQLRGFATNRVLIVVDGVRMNNAIFRSGNLQNVISIDANSLESAEVLFGPGAVMYGSDAIGGVMDFQTKKARFTTDSLRPLIKTNMYSRYSSASNEWSSHLDFNYGTKKWAFLTTASYSIFDDLKSGSYGDSAFLRPVYQGGDILDQKIVTNEDPRVQKETGYEQYNFLQKIAFRPNEKRTFEYCAIFTGTSDAPRYDRLIQDEDSNDTLDYYDWYYGPQEWMMHRFSYEDFRTARLHEKVRVLLSYQRFLESRHDLKWGSTTYRRQYESLNAFALNADFEKALGTRIDLYYGGELVFNKVGSHAYREDYFGDQMEINSRYPDQSDWMTAGIYANAITRLSENFELNSGIRYSYYHIRAGFDTSLFAYPVTSLVNNNSSVNGSLGLVYHRDQKLRVYLNLASAFRAPNIDDIGKVFDSQPGSVVVPNPDLKPETAYSSELGFKKLLGNKLMLEAAGYYIYLDDALARADYTFNGQDSILYDGEMSRVQAVQNLSHAYVYGVQGGIEFRIVEGLKVYGSVNYQEGFEYHADSAKYFPKTHIMPLFGKAALRYRKSQLFLEFYCEFQGGMDADELPLVERDKLFYARDPDGRNYVPSWYTLNFKASYFFNKHLSLNAGIENITDRLYRTMGSGISAPGRNYLVSLKASF